MTKKKIILFIILGVVLIGVFRFAYLVKKSGEAHVFDANAFSGITTNELLDKMGDYSEKEEWVNETSKGSFNFTTYSYDIDGNHYEFIVCDDSVVRVSVYSQKYWTGEGESFKYQISKSEILTMFDIDLGNDAKQVVNNGLTWRISSVSDTITEIDIQDIDSKEKTFEFVKITYNQKYFD